MTHDGKVAVVTGAAQGIGLGICRHLLKEGYAVAMLDRQGTALKKAAALFRSSTAVFTLTADVSRETDVRRAMGHVRRRFGRLDALVNNAGISDPRSGLSVRRWHAIIGVNLTGAFLCATAALPLLKKSKGAIVNIASTRALMSEPDTEAYAASKGGLVALTHALAISVGPAVRVNGISPGWIVTDPEAKLRPVDHAQHPVGRAGRPEDVAALTAYLLSEEAGFMTGQTLVLDGGMTRKMIYAE